MSYLKDLLGNSYKEGMSEEEMSAAIEKAVSEREKERDKETKKAKASFDRTSSEIAEYKRQLNDYKQQLKDRMTDEEKNRKEQEDLLEALRKDNEEMKKQIAIADSKAKLAGLGYSEDLASETATALYSGDLETVYRNQKAFMEAREKEIRAQVIKDTPVPPAGSGTSVVTKESILAIQDPSERQEAMAQNHELFGF